MAVNIYEMVSFRNGSNFPLEMTFDGESFGICPPHTSRQVPRFVAEYWAQRNLQYHLEEAGDRSAVIEEGKQGLFAQETTIQRQINQELDHRETMKKSRAKAVKAEAEGVLEESEAADTLGNTGTLKANAEGTAKSVE